jgi:peptide/nickel transport system substrate-binding protein
MMKKRTLALILAVTMLLAFAAACNRSEPTDPNVSPSPDAGENGETQEPVVEIPRNETLYFNGFMWGAPLGWNPFSTEMNNPLAVNQDPDGARVAMMETPYMYNMLDNSMVPLLADGDYSWNADRTELSYSINPAARWSDGTSVTAHDAAFTWEAGLEYSTTGNATWTPFISDVTAADDSTVVIEVVMVEHKGAMVPANPMMVRQFLGQQYILQKAWLETLIERNGGDPAAISQDRALGDNDLVFSGPYGPFHLDSTQAILIRNDNYWGQDESMWGGLPAPKYLANVNFETNAAGDSVFLTGGVDISQNFIANVHEHIEAGLPISTYLDSAPWHISANMPTAYFNMNSPKPGLDRAEVRRAIAIAVDYDMIIANAMTGQSPSFADVPRSLMNPTASEQAMYNRSAVSGLQWTGRDITGANALLDTAGILRNPDNGGPDGGWREIDGEILAYNVCAPEGWSDWNAAMEIVAAAGSSIGIRMDTFFPSWDVYQTVFTQANQTEYDIFMWSTQGISPAQPYSRIRALLGNDFEGLDHNWNGNFGQFFHERALEIISVLPFESGDTLRALYTELVQIYLTEVPSFSLMYRPEKFHTVNESVWTGFTEAGDGNNIPPVNSITGFAIADLYNLRLVNP